MPRQVQNSEKLSPIDDKKPANIADYSENSIREDGASPLPEADLEPNFLNENSAKEQQIVYEKVQDDQQSE